MAQVTVLSERLRGEGERPYEELAHRLRALDGIRPRDLLIRIGCAPTPTPHQGVTTFAGAVAGRRSMQPTLPR